MLKEYERLYIKIIELLEKSPGQTIKELAKRLKVNRTFLSGYLRALEDQGSVKSKRIGPARAYFKEELQR